MSAHTPGPWVLVGGADSSPQVIAPGLADICTMHGAFSHKGVMADARLIAAAPELLEALQTCLLIVEHLAADSAPSTIKEARAAIRKATGEQA